MLEQLAADLARDEIQFALARDIGRVGGERRGTTARELRLP
jgi:hypothetical protein